MRALLLPVGEDLYAIEMAVAREVVAAPSLAQVPSAPPTVLGVFNLRGEIVPVFDTGMLLGLGSLPSLSFVAVVDTSFGPAGLGMTGVGESAELDEPIAVTETTGTRASYAVGERLVVLVDVEQLLAPHGTDA